MHTFLEQVEIDFFRERYENTYNDKWVGSDDLLVLIIEAQKTDHQADEDIRMRQEKDTLEAMRDYVP